MKNRVRFFNGSAIWIGIITATLCFLAQTLLGSPLSSLHILKGSSLLPPIWIFNVLSIAWCFLIGISAGAIINATSLRLNNGEKEIAAYKGGFFFLTFFFLSFLRYYLLFYATRLFLSLIISVIVLICSLLCAFSWHKVKPSMSSAIIILFAIWQFYILFVNLSIFLHN